MFCYHEHQKAVRQKERQMPVGGKELSIAQTLEVEPTRKARIEPVKPVLEWVPLATKTLLRKLNLDPNKVAKLGFYGIKRQIIESAESKAAGLTEKEKQVVKIRLDGKKTRAAATLLNITRFQNISVIETRAAKKIRWRLKVLKLKAKS